NIFLVPGNPLSQSSSVWPSSPSWSRRLSCSRTSFGRRAIFPMRVRAERRTPVRRESGGLDSVLEDRLRPARSYPSPRPSPSGRGYLFSVGGAGDPPAPLGDSPSGTGWTFACCTDVPLRTARLPVPSGGSPDGTAESPVPPTLRLPPPKLFAPAQQQRPTCAAAAP